MQIRNLQGKFTFQVQQFYDRSLNEYKNWLHVMGYFLSNDYKSNGLKEYSTWLSISNSYEQCSRILSRQMGESILSDQSIYHIVESKVQELSNQSKLEVLKTLKALDMPSIQESVNLYNVDNEEILLF